MSTRLLKIGAAAEMLGTTPAQEDRRVTACSQDATRYYSIADIMGLANEAAPTICYARVSSHDQKADLERQHAALEAFCASKGWRSETIKDLGSGMNYRKKGLQRLLEMILRRQMKRLVLTHKDRLIRFGAELVFTLCELRGIEIVIIHKDEQPSFEEEQALDMLEIITVFSARLYGARSHKAKKLMDSLADDDTIKEAKGQLALL